MLLANEGRKVTVVFGKADAILAVSRPLPPFIRKSRLVRPVGMHRWMETWVNRFWFFIFAGSFLFFPPISNYEAALSSLLSSLF